MKIKTKNKLKDFKSSKTGIVNQLYLYSNETDDPRTYNIFASYCNLKDIFHIEGDFQLRPGASDIKFKNARNAAIGEVLERYSMIKPQNVEEKRIEAVVNSTSLSLSEIRWFHEEQWKEISYSKPALEDKIGFMSGIDSEGKEIYFPAQFLKPDYQRSRREPNIGYSYSTGMATGYSYQETIKNGMLEQLERDAAISAWFEEGDLKKIGSYNDFEVEKLERSIPNSMEYALLDITTDLEVPSVMGIAYNKSRDMGPVFSISSELSFQEAYKDALIELCQVWINYKRVRYTEPELTNENSKDLISDLESRITDVQRNPKKKISIQQLIHKLKKKGLSTYIFDMTPSELAKNDLITTKAVIPDLLQFSHPEEMYLGSKRFYEKDFDFDRCRDNPPPFLH